MKIYDILILISLAFLIYLFYVLTSDYYTKSYCKKNNYDNSYNSGDFDKVEYINYENNLKYENFTKDYYSYNWTSPTLIKDINEDTLDIDKKIHRCSDCEKNKNIKKVSYSMSCDLTDDSSNPNCFAGYDIPTENRNHTV